MIGASADSIEVIESVLLSCAGSRFRLKTARIIGRVVDLGIIITSSDREKFVAGARMYRNSELLCHFASHKAPVMVRPQRSFGSLPHDRSVDCAPRRQRAPQPRSQSTSYSARFCDPTPTDLAYGTSDMRLRTKDTRSIVAAAYGSRDAVDRRTRSRTRL